MVDAILVGLRIILGAVLTLRIDVDVLLVAPVHVAVVELIALVVLIAVCRVEDT